jgi:hypothetical protein
VAKSKEKTIEQAEAAQAKAVRFLRDVVGDEDKAAEIEDLDVSEYAERKNFIITNPTMPHASGLTLPLTFTRRAKAMENLEWDDDLSNMTKPQLLEAAQSARNTVRNIWDHCLDSDADEAGSLSKEDCLAILDDIAEECSELLPDEFTVEESEDDQEEEAA